MRFTCEKSALVLGLNITGRTVAQKSALASLEGILCIADDTLRLTGFNMETAITYTVEAEITETGKCVLPARLFGDIIRRLPEGPVTVTVDEKFKISVKSGYAASTISAEGAEDYPKLPEVEKGSCIHIPQTALKELIGGTLFSVSENEARPIHTGVKFEITNDTVSAVAVDGYRLARRTYHTEAPTGKELSFVVPSQSLKEVEKILQDGDEDVSFTLGARHILFTMGPATLICRLLDGDFLDWRRVVPTNCPVKLIAEVSELITSLERVGVVVSEKYKSPVRCNFGNQVLYLKTNTTIGLAQDQCSFAGNGGELEIGFNVRYLIDALRAVPSDEVTLELTNSLSPIVMTPVDDKHDFAYMVLPVRISN